MLEALRQLPHFKHFSDAQLEQLRGCAFRHQYPEGAMVIQERETTREAFIVESGEVSLQRQTSYGSFEVTRLTQGQLFGEMNFVDGDTRSVDALTLAPCDLLVLNPVRLEQLCAEDPAFEVAFTWTLWKSLSAKLRQTNNNLSRFFIDETSANDSPRAMAEAVEDTKIDIEDKRAVFREQGLSNMEVNYLASLCEARRFRPGQLVFADGDDGDRMYVVVEGRIMISKIIPGAGEEAMAFLGRGEFFGEMSLIDDLPRSADAAADAGGALLLSIRREVLSKILDIDRASSIRLLKVLTKLLAKRLRETNEKIIGWYILSGGSHREGLPHQTSAPSSSDDD